MKLHVGTSGYSYKEWKGNFYPEDLPDKQMLHFYGERFRSYALEASTNLANWTPLATNVYYNAVVFADSAAPSYPARFYRVRLVEP